MLSILIYCLINYLSISYQIKFIFFFFNFYKEVHCLNCTPQILACNLLFKRKIEFDKANNRENFLPFNCQERDISTWKFDIYCPGSWGEYQGAPQPMLLCVTLCHLINVSKNSAKILPVKGLFGLLLKNP